MKLFEYKIVTISTLHLRKKDFQSELNLNFQEWGNKGWELIEVKPILTNGFLSGSRTKEFIIIFKKLKSSKSQ